MSKPPHHQPHIHKEVGTTSLKHHGHASARNDLVVEVLTEGAFHLLLEATFKRVDEPLGEGMPGGALEGLGFGPDDVVPNVCNEEQMCIVLLSEEGEDFRTGGIFWQRLEKFQRCIWAPVEAEDLRKVALCHGRSPGLPSDGWFQSSSWMN